MICSGSDNSDYPVTIIQKCVVSIPHQPLWPISCWMVDIGSLTWAIILTYVLCTESRPALTILHKKILTRKDWSAFSPWLHRESNSASCSRWIFCTVPKQNKKQKNRLLKALSLMVSVDVKHHERSRKWHTSNRGRWSLTLTLTLTLTHGLLWRPPTHTQRSNVGGRGWGWRWG